MKNILETFQTLESEKLQIITEKLKNFSDSESILEGVSLNKLSIRLAEEKGNNMSETRINIAILAEKYRQKLNGVLEDVLL